MTLTRTLLGLGSLLCVTAAPATALSNDDTHKCAAYGSVGASMADFILPITVKEMVGIMQGTEPELMMKMTMQLMSGLTPEELQAMVSLGETQASMLGEMAGTQAMQLLMTAQASTSEEVDRTLQAQCTRVGFDALLESQRRINSLEENAR